MKNYFQRLRTIFAFRNYYHKCHLLLIYVLVLIYSLSKEYYIILIFTILLLLFFTRNKSVLIISVILSLLITINIGLKKYYYDNLKMTFIDTTVKVYKVTTYDDYQKVYVKYKNYKFYFNDNNQNYFAGDIIKIKGDIEKATSKHTPNGFDYQEYLEYEGICGKITPLCIQKINYTFSLNIIHEKISQYIRNNFDISYGSILSALVIGDKTNLNEDLTNQIQKVGIGHLFVISGLHMSIVILIVTKILKLLKVKDIIQPYFVTLFLMVYFIISSFMVSILRVIISYIFNNNSKMKNFTQIDKLSLNVILVLIINPYYLFSYSFLLSYIIVFAIALISNKLNNKKGIKSFLYNNFLISLTSIFITLPIVSKINPDVNFLSVLFNLFFIPFVSYIVLPLSFLTVLVPPICFLYEIIISLFLFLTKICSLIDFFTISFSHISMLFIIIYYVIFILLIKNKHPFKSKKLIVSYSFVVFIWLLQPYLNIKNEIHFISLPSGESTLITKHNNLTNILIDTGDIDAQELINYLKRRGIKKLDAVIISHGDSDHIGGLYSLIDEFVIKEIYISKYDFESVKRLQTINLKKTKIIKVAKGDKIIIKNYIFNVLWPEAFFKDTNNTSLVLLADINRLKILFTGDIEKEVERELIKMYNNLKVDILKVAHHGSNTSSTSDFLKSIKFHTAIAMNGHQNTFGFPSASVIKRFDELKNIKMYNTINYGTISLEQYIWENNYQISWSYN